jgi:hypothetical protein
MSPQCTDSKSSPNAKLLRTLTRTRPHTATRCSNGFLIVAMIGLSKIHSVGTKTLRNPQMCVYQFVAFNINMKLGRYKTTFVMNGKRCRYFYHCYDVTWNNPRCVEVPIIWERVANCPRRVLEVGTVLSHYLNLHHDVIDKYEKWPGVSNEDVVSALSYRLVNLVNQEWSEGHIDCIRRCPKVQIVHCAKTNIQPTSNS